MEGLSARHGRVRVASAVGRDKHIRWGSYEAGDCVVGAVYGRLLFGGAGYIRQVSEREPHNLYRH